jgi:hypothetical protein
MGCHGFPVCQSSLLCFQSLLIWSIVGLTSSADTVQASILFLLPPMYVKNVLFYSAPKSLISSLPIAQVNYYHVLLNKLSWMTARLGKDDKLVSLMS